MGCESSKANETENQTIFPNQVSSTPVVKNKKEEENKQGTEEKGEQESQPVSSEVTSETQNATEETSNENSEMVKSTITVMKPA
ncbi:hypothetical protein GPJ56_000376 [Histomonas meleagridis]|uniref:uncharacterized protein n=1 Tax=Histomonas meleagridis TaxID=135588 RepID=UPI00355A4E29|nr:hypothetical protein GPJ56_000374 [Histomonas meleagridis]KAH0795497.1 hypothetical protein GPJ56_000376 [Histomonas meleagridis]KAH0796584.1 hypothetical protein GO595_010477 [Histomonas meleagridis]KAH0796587.1 hypothetical protein GO595_010480 [Histomonas meleagridis]